MATLLGSGEGLRPHDIYALIAQDQLFVDLDRVSLRDHYRALLYPDQHTAQALAYLGPNVCSPNWIGESLPFSSLSTNTRLLWDGCIWTLVNLGETTTTLLPESGEPIQLPSAFFLRMALRICVKRFGRMPHSLVVDGGKEFQSEYFDALVAHYHTLKKIRPGAKPRFGSVVERLFGTTNTEFVYNLLVNFYP